MLGLDFFRRIFGFHFGILFIQPLLTLSANIAPPFQTISFMLAKIIGCDNVQMTNEKENMLLLYRHHHYLSIESIQQANVLLC
jgi:hypothetical protein